MARKPADQSVNRDEILAAAAAVLHQHGYEAATMKAIAASVNLTAASLYHHFPSKDALLLAVLETGIALILEQIEAIACSHQPPADKLAAMTREHIIGLTENTAVGAAMVFEIRALMQAKPPAPEASDEEHAAYADWIARRNAFFAQRDRFEGWFRRVLQEGIDDGAFRAVDVPIAVKTMLGAQNWVGVWYRPDGRLDGEAIAAHLADTLLAGLRAPLAVT